jgi:DNA-binding LacI/PurR family transcriptional regulator
MSTTIKDIAKRTGVTHSTVSRALHGSPLISDETTERVQQTAREMGYHASAAARSLKTNQTRAIGVVVRNIDDPFFGEILQGIEDIAQEGGYSLFISSSRNEADRERSIVQAMREHRVDGIIICSTSFSTSQSRHLQDYDVPIVVVNNQAAEDYRYAISHNDEDGSRQVTRHLINLGHRRVAYLGNSAAGRTNQDRLAGFQIEMVANGLQVEQKYIRHIPGSDPDHGLEGLGYFLDLPDRPTALVCFNDMLAIGVLKGLQTAGIRVPEDCSVTGFDNIVFSAFTNPALTTFDQPKHYIGAEAARLVLDMLKPDTEGNPPDPLIRTLNGRLLVRESTAPPATN